MDNRPADHSVISRCSWPVALWLSGFLDQAERGAVVGDLTECGESGGRAVVNVLGLVLRRKAAVFLDPRLWVAVALFILPVSYLLSAIAGMTAAEGAVYFWMYLNNWDWALTANPGFWHVLRETALNVGVTFLILGCWSWSAGFLIGHLPNRILRASRDAFIVLLGVLLLGDAPARIVQLWMYFHRVPSSPKLPDMHAPITANVFYHVFFPWIVLAILVMLPAFSGIRHAQRPFLQSQKVRVVLVTAATISLLILLVQTSVEPIPSLGLLLGAPARQWLWHNQNWIELLPWLCCWPVFYVIAIRFGHHRRREAVMAQ